MHRHQPYIQSVIDKSLNFSNEFLSGLQFIADLIPEEMIDHSKPPVNNEIVFWKAIPAHISKEEFIEFENTIGYPLPETYKAFLSYKHFIEISFGHEADFFRHTPYWTEEYFKNVSGIWKKETFDAGFFPFASKTDTGCFCFDTNNAKQDNEYRIVTYDHEWGIEEYPSKGEQYTFIDFVKELETTLGEWKQRKNNK